MKTKLKRRNVARRKGKGLGCTSRPAGRCSSPLRQRTKESFKRFLFTRLQCEAMSDMEEDGLIPCSGESSGNAGTSSLAYREKAIEEAQICLEELLSTLNEKNVDLFVRIVACVGVKVCRDILQETQKVQRRGGLLTETGRRRTPGGVFICLLRERIPKADVDFIWEDQKKSQTAFKRDRKTMSRLDQLVKERLTMNDAPSEAGSVTDRQVERPPPTDLGDMEEGELPEMDRREPPSFSTN